jgi:hypothetical protein
MTVYATRRIPHRPCQIGANLGLSAFVLAATAGGFRVGLLLMIAVSAGAFACILALPAHSLHGAHHRKRG